MPVRAPVALEEQVLDAPRRAANVEVGGARGRVHARRGGSLGTVEDGSTAVDVVPAEGRSAPFRGRGGLGPGSGAREAGWRRTGRDRAPSQDPFRIGGVQFAGVGVLVSVAMGG